MFIYWNWEQHNTQCLSKLHDWKVFNCSPNPGLLVKTNKKTHNVSIFTHLTLKYNPTHAARYHEYSGKYFLTNSEAQPKVWELERLILNLLYLYIIFDIFGSKYHMYFNSFIYLLENYYRTSNWQKLYWGKKVDLALI